MEGALGSILDQDFSDGMMRNGSTREKITNK